LAKLTPGTPEHKRVEAQYSRLKAKFDRAQEEPSSEFSRRESEILTQVCGEITAVISVMAKQRGLTLVVQAENSSPESGPQTPDAVAQIMVKMSHPIIYADPRCDLTKEVIDQLNRQHRAALN
jgi:Skp family chaperone for outer membrane proteins